MSKTAFLSPKEKAELGIKKAKPTPPKGSPEYKTEKLKNWTLVLVFGSVLLTLLGIFATWSQANVSALGFGKLGRFFWIPYLCSFVPAAGIVTSIILSQRKTHFATQLIVSCLAVICLVSASLFFQGLGSIYTDGEKISKNAQFACGCDLEIDESDTYTLELENGIKATYYARPGYSAWPKDIPFNYNLDVEFFDNSNFKLDDIPAFTYYHKSAIFDVTTSRWISRYSYLKSGTYNLILFIESSGSEAGIIITGINATIS